MELRELRFEDCEEVRGWRNKQSDMLRTPYFLTEFQQAKFYQEVVCNRSANARYFGVFNGDVLIGMGGIENIQWENRLGEISLMMNPIEWVFADEALKLILDKGFNGLNLENIYAEVYECNPRYDFWIDEANKYHPTTAVLPSRKYLKGMYYNSLYYNFTKKEFLNYENTIS